MAVKVGKYILKPSWKSKVNQYAQPIINNNPLPI